jgi:Tol biopolymer transport system component
VFSANGNVIAGGDPSLSTAFVYTTATGALEPESFDASGNPVNTTDSLSISADGNVITFMTSAAATPDTPIATESQGAAAQLYARNRAQHTTVLVDKNGPNMTRDREPFNSAGNISSDGRYIAYVCWCQRLISGAGSEHQGVYRTDLATGAVIEMDATESGIQGDDTIIEPGSVGITADGSQVAYASRDSNLVPGDTNNSRDVFVATPVG